MSLCVFRSRELPCQAQAQACAHMQSTYKHTLLCILTNHSSASLMLFFAYMYTLTLTVAHSHTHILTLTYTLSHTHSHTQSLYLSLSLSLSFSLSFSHTHTHTRVRRSVRALPKHCCPTRPVGASRCSKASGPLRPCLQPQSCPHFKLLTRRCSGICRWV